jgi:hypothetical protein
VTDVWLPRRWLYGAENTHLNAWPWVPDFQLRFSVNDARPVRSPAVRHVSGRGGRSPRATRPSRSITSTSCARTTSGSARSRRTTASGPGCGSPASRSTRPSTCRSSATPVASPADLPRATREEIDAHWSGVAPDYAVELAVRSAPARLEAGERAPVVLALANHGAADLRPESVQVGSRWDDGAPGLWSPLPATVAAGGEAIVPATVEAPGAPGSHVLELDLVHEGVRWFEAPVRLSIEVTTRRRVGTLVREATRSRGPALAGGGRRRRAVARARARRRGRRRRLGDDPGPRVAHRLRARRRTAKSSARSRKPDAAHRHCDASRTCSRSISPGSRRRPCWSAGPSSPRRSSPPTARLRSWSRRRRAAPSTGCSCAVSSGRAASRSETTRRCRDFLARL